MKNIIMFIASLGLLSNSFGGCTKTFEGVTLLPNKSGTLPVPRGYHEDYMRISCSVKNLDFVPNNEPVAFLAGNQKVVMTEECMKELNFYHKHLNGEGDVFHITLRNYDDTARILFYNCKSTCY